MIELSHLDLESGGFVYVSSEFGVELLAACLAVSTKRQVRHGLGEASKHHV